MQIITHQKKLPGFYTRILSLFLMFAMAVTLFAGCDNNDTDSKNESAPDFPVTVTGVTLKKAPERIISLSPSVTAVLRTLGASAAVIGLDNISVLDGEFTRLGSAVLPDLDKILELSPDLVFTSAALPADVSAKLALEEIPVAIITTPSSYDGLALYYEQISTLVSGVSTGKSNAQNTVSRLNQKFTDAEALSEGSEPPNVCLLLGAAAGATGDTIAGQMISFAGGQNAADAKTGYAFALSDLAAAFPDYIFCPSTLISTIKSGKEYQDIPAVKNEKVFPLDPYFVETLGEDELLSAVKVMGSAMYPGLFATDTSSAIVSDSSSAGGAGSAD